MKKFKEKYLKENKELKILELGSQDVNGTYKRIFKNPNWDYIGLDIEKGKNVDIVLKNPYTWKEIKNNSIDIIISGQVLEHTEYFWLIMLEISKKLKSQGIACIIVPSAGPNHTCPFDCWRFREDILKAMAKFASLEILETKINKKSEPWEDAVLVCEKNKSKINQIKTIIKQKILQLI